MNKTKVLHMIGALAAALLLPSQAAAEPVTLPMDLSTGRPIVSGKLQGEGPFKVIVDTGGPNGISGGVASTVADTLKLPVNGTIQARSPAAGGTPQEVPVHEAASLSFGSYEMKNVRLGRNSNMLTAVGGELLVGNSVFGSDGKVLELDLANKQLRIVDAPTAAVTQWHSIDRQSGHLHLPITIGGKSFPAVLDTGFPGHVTVPKAAIDEIPLAGAPKVVGRGRTVDSEFEVLGAPLAGEVFLGDLKLPVTDARFGPFPRVVVGTAALKDMTIVVDWKNQRFAIVRSASGAKTIS